MRLLDDEMCCDQIKLKLNSLINVPHANPIEKWEKLKTGIVKYIQNIARQRANEEKLTIASLSEKINDYEENMPLSALDYEMYLKQKQI